MFAMVQAEDAAPPLLWVLTGPKAGDNSQILKAAEASGLGFEIKKIAIRQGCETEKPRVVPSLAYVDASKSDTLSPPWPVAVLAIGRHMSLVALWIKQQSGGRTRIALFNAPKGQAAAFDLVVLPPYYRATGRANELVIRMPLIGVDPVRLAEARGSFRDELAIMPRPLHVLLMGGDMGQRKLLPDFALSTLQAMQKGFASQGSIYAVTSRRTSPAVGNALAAAMRPQDRIFMWGKNEAQNPYFGLLAHGDSFTVTADSLSMLIEVARLGKPLIIAEPPEPGGFFGLGARLAAAWRARDLRKALKLLYDGGYAARLGAPLRTPPGPLADDAELVGERLRALVAGKVEPPR
jgi:mitochondrial fission protein ELM1